MSSILLKAQGVLFADGSDRHHHAVVSNMEWDGARLLEWHRLKAGTVEHVHDELKNGLAAGHMPSQRFAVNAAWLKLASLSYNIASAIRGLCLNPQERTARFKKYRLLMVHVAGRMNRNNCVMGLRLCASPQTIARISAVWEVFGLPTQATLIALAEYAPGRAPLSAASLLQPSQARHTYHPPHRHAPRPAALCPSVTAESLLLGDTLHRLPSVGAHISSLNRVPPSRRCPQPGPKAHGRRSRLRRGFGNPLHRPLQKLYSAYLCFCS